MPIPIPILDDLTWEDLVAEGRSLIPGVAPEWTNHNASDPGITLMELFAYLTEMLLYQVDQITVESTAAMLALINGPGWKPPVARGLAQWEHLKDAEREAVRQLREVTRAVTSEDFELLTRAWNRTPGLPDTEQVARAKCIPDRNLNNERPAALDEVAIGHVSVLVLPIAPRPPEPPSDDLLQKILAHLEPARLLTTRVHVVAPRFAGVGVHVELVVDQTVGAVAAKAKALGALEKFLDPCCGGSDGKGWPFGRNIYVSELYEMLGKLPGTAYVQRRPGDQPGTYADDLTVASGENWRLERHPNGELESVKLNADELPCIDKENFHVEARTGTAGDRK